MRSGDRGAEAKARRRAAAGALLCLPLVVFLLAFVFGPLARLAGNVLTREGINAVGRVLAAGRYRTALVNSFLLSGSAALVALALALVPAWILGRESFRGRNVLRALVSLPLTFSGVLVGFLVLVMLGRVGAVPTLVRLLAGRDLLGAPAYTFVGLFAAYLYFELPRAVVTLEPAFRRFPTELDAAARALGAGPVRRFLEVVLPLTASAMRSTLAVTFSASMGSFGVALILSRRFTVAPLEIYTELTAFLNDSVAGALCILLAVAAFGVDRALSGGRP